MAEIAQPHDRFFKALMASPGAANALFRERLPRRLVAELADAPAEPVGAELIDARLQSSSADGLYRLWLRGRRPLFVYSLVEHKSAPEPDSALQLLGYMVRIWEGEKPRSGAGKKLPAIVPLVVYHGARAWRVPPFRELVDLEDGLWPAHLDFGVVVVDVGDIEDEELSRDATLRAGLMELKYATRSEQQPSKLRAVLNALKRTPSLIGPGLAYIMGAYKQIDRARLLGEVKEVMPEHEGELMSIAAREWMADGRLQGQKEGLEQGHRDSLVRILERRFGAIPGAIRARILSGNMAEVDAWFDSAVDAGALEDVFGEKH
jgi:predicted transposase YdaD